ncbi:MAG: HAMP domain-containing sensor histidine kinase [Bacilli bacterium]|nr:HAMP domain-containing sensor histidine kinase [Bacilli bacterium]
MHLKKNSLKTKIWLYLAFFSVVILLFLWFFQVVSLNTYYKWYKTKEIENISNQIRQKKQVDINTLDDMAFDHGICIEVVQGSSTTYISNSYNKGCLLGDATRESNYKDDFITSNLKKRNYELINPRFNNKTIISASRIDKDVYLYVSASLQPLDSSILILKSQLLYVSFIVLILAFLIGYFISKKISRPMEKLQKSAKRMAKGEYNVVFDADSDIAELQSLAQTLSYTRDELSKTDELRRELLANVGHDLKTPLTMIKAYAEMVKDLSYKNKNKREKHLCTIIEETDRLNLLVNDILDLSRMQSQTMELKKTTFNLHELIETILSRYTILKETEKYQFIYENKQDIYIEADRHRIEQVIYNLINNAIQYTGSDNKIYILLQVLKKEVYIAVRDTGKGIPKEQQKYIWDKYYHSEKKHKRNAIGTGLGLSIVKNILEMHAYKYGVTSSSKGTEFYFYVELNQEKE